MYFFLVRSNFICGFVVDPMIKRKIFDEERRHNALLNCQICDRFHDINFHVFLYILFIFYTYHHCLYICLTCFLSPHPHVQRHVSRVKNNNKVTKSIKFNIRIYKKKYVLHISYYTYLQILSRISPTCMSTVLLLILFRNKVNIIIISQALCLLVILFDNQTKYIYLNV